jgi:3-keto-5-aminohexanoate cleavage enzyme
MSTEESLRRASGVRGKLFPVKRTHQTNGALPPLIVTATPNICWLQPDVPYPRTVDEMVVEAERCEAAGAQVLHVHADDWAPMVAALRENTGMVIQCGMSSVLVDERHEIFESRADMISVILNHHDEAFAEADVHELHPREELVEYARLSAEYGVRLEFEVWHTGAIWNLNYLIEAGVLEPPYVTTLFFGWPGGTWSPPTVEEYLYRRSYLPPKCAVTVSIMDPAQMDVISAAIRAGDNVRVGTEDYPLNRNGQRAATHELVAEIVDLAAHLGRPLASRSAAGELLGV